MSSIAQYILDKKLTTYDFVTVEAWLHKKPLGLISKKGMQAIIFEIEYRNRIELQKGDKETKRDPQELEPYLPFFKNLDGVLVGKMPSGNALIQYFLPNPGMKSEAKRLTNEFKKLAKTYKLKPIMITFAEDPDNTMNVHIPLNPKTIEFLTKLEERLNIREKG